jgi:Asp-tRNA(Asn)/Glu-tRNA(Gln) amidotransferase A subunit family amidase
MTLPPSPADCWAPGSASYPATGTGPLSGRTLAVKDMIAVPGHVSSFGHPRWRQPRGPGSQAAPVLSALLAAGASELLPAGAIAVVPVMAGLAPLRMASPADLRGFRSSTLRYTAPASLTGRPELVVPVIGGGSPVGVGILGSAGGDAGLVQIAGRICPAAGPLDI